MSPSPAGACTRRSPEPSTRDSWPDVDVIVPVFNEAATIIGKLANLEQLDYPGDRLRVIVVDGQSDDGSADLAETWSRHSATCIAIVRSDAVGKPEQIMAALAGCSAEWVLITDADARLPATTLKSLVRLALADPGVALVGTQVRPAAAHPFDHAHWTIVNWLRRVERRLGSAGLVVGPCYLARRDLLDTLSPHAISDDVHISCLALLAGRRIELASETVLELRTPTGGAELLRHKTRRALGYVHEVAHFLPQSGVWHPVQSLIFFGRASLLFALPCLALGLAGVVLANPGWVLGAAAAALAGVVMILRTGPAGTRYPLVRLGALVASPLLTSVVLTMAVLLWPFVRQSPRYPKVSLSGSTLADADAS